MPSPSEQEYWPELLRSIPETPLAELASAHGLLPAELDAALAATTGDRPVQQELWWPEVLRQQEQGSLRELARRFGTNPRRIRRGLARVAVRVAGASVKDEAPPKLAEIRDRLGKEPDRTLASAAGVTVEAIQGERRRLGIEPYKMKPDVEEWGGKPVVPREKARPKRRWQDAPVPEIIRRSGAPAAPAAPAPVVERAAPPPRTLFRAVENAPSATPVLAPAAALPGLPTLATRERAPLSEREGESPYHPLGLSAADRQRRRIVRPTAPEADERPPAPSTARLPRLKASPRVKLVQAEVPAQPGLRPAPAGPSVQDHSPALRGQSSSAGEEPPDPPEDASEPADLPPDADGAGADAPPEAAADSEPGFVWQVEIEGQGRPLYVLADDIAGALERAARHLGLGRVASGRAWRLAEFLPSR